MWRNRACFTIAVAGIGAIISTMVLLAATRIAEASQLVGNSNSISTARPIMIAGIENAFRVSDRIYSGGQPDGEADFTALAKLGIKTIVSVDGRAPEVVAARKWGMRYIHLPLGYDGIPTNRVAELAKAMTTAEGPLFVHCHHGKHRGPTAIAIMCESSGLWSAAQAVAWLRQAGTSDDYPGLYRAAAQFQSPTVAEMAAVKELPETAKTSSLVEAMVEIDRHFDALKQSQAALWQTPKDHPDLVPANEATILWELLRETRRISEGGLHGTDFLDKLSQTETNSHEFARLLQTSTPHIELNQAFRTIQAGCAGCHGKYRNN